MAPTAAQQAHGKTTDGSMYLVTTSAAASFVHLEGERWNTTIDLEGAVESRDEQTSRDGRAREEGSRRKKKSWEEGCHAGTPYPHELAYV